MSSILDGFVLVKSSPSKRGRAAIASLTVSKNAITLSAEAVNIFHGRPHLEFLNSPDDGRFFILGGHRASPDSRKIKNPGQPFRFHSLELTRFRKRA